VTDISKALIFEIALLMLVFGYRFSEAGTRTGSVITEMQPTK
jgi:hypothetical protein